MISWWHQNKLECHELHNQNNGRGRGGGGVLNGDWKRAVLGIGNQFVSVCFDRCSPSY